MPPSKTPHAAHAAQPAHAAQQSQTGALDKSTSNGKPSNKILQRFYELASDPLTLSYLVDGFLPDDSRTLLVGDSGVGKSTFAAQLCAALEEGEPFLEMGTKRTTCLYFQADVGVPIWKEQIKRIAPESRAWSLHSIPTGALDKVEYIEVIKKVIEYTRPGFIIYDALNSLTGKDINGKGVMETIYLMYNISVDKSGNPIPHLLIHHPSKDGKRGVNGAAGYHGISASYDTYLNLGLQRLKIEKSRVITNKVIRLRKNSQGKWLLNPITNTTHTLDDDVCIEGYDRQNLVIDPSLDIRIN